MSTEKPEQIIAEYLALRAGVDRKIEQLLAIHSEHINCRAKCCLCCVNLSVFPVEFQAIKAELTARSAELSFDEAAACGFLKEQLCILYASRPLICRTHGLPIVFLNDEVDPPQYAVDFCPENFIGDSGAEVEFNPDNILNIDEMNEELFAINQRYVEALADNNLTPLTRIPLAELLQE